MINDIYEALIEQRSFSDSDSSYTGSMRSSSDATSSTSLISPPAQARYIAATPRRDICKSLIPFAFVPGKRQADGRKIAEAFEGDESRAILLFLQLSAWRIHDDGHPHDEDSD